MIVQKSMVDDRKTCNSKETMNQSKVHVKDIEVQVSVSGHRCGPCGITFED